MTLATQYNPSAKHAESNDLHVALTEGFLLFVTGWTILLQNWFEVLLSKISIQRKFQF